MHNIADKKLLMLRPYDIISSGNTVRQFFNPDELKLLSRSISVNGIIEPLAVRKAKRGKYILISGERRLKAAKMAGLRRIPCVLYKLDEQTSSIYSLAVNMHHSRLTFFEEARFINSLIFEQGLSEAELSVRLGITQSAIALKLKLLRLDKLSQQKIAEYNLTEAHARALLKLPEERREAVADLFFSGGIAPENADRFVSEILNPPRRQPILHTEAPNPPADIGDGDKTSALPAKNEQPIQTTKASIGDIRLFENSLCKLNETLSAAGIRSSLKVTEAAKHIEYRVRIDKSDLTAQKFKQLKIC